MKTIFKQPKRTYEDIDVYTVRAMENEEILSPFFRMYKWEIGREYCVHEKKDNNEPQSYYYSCSRKEKLLKYFLSTSRTRKKIKNLVMFKALIPSGSKYFFGDCGGSLFKRRQKINCFASNRIRLIKLEESLNG